MIIHSEMELIELISLTKINRLKPIRVEIFSSSIELSRKTSLHSMVSSLGASLGNGIKLLMVNVCLGFTALSPR